MVTISDFECDNPPPPYKHDATCLWRRNCEYNYMGISPRARILIFAFNFQDMNITTLIPSGQFSILIARDTSNWLCIYVMHETLNMCINNCDFAKDILFFLINIIITFERYSLVYKKAMQCFFFCFSIIHWAVAATYIYRLI